MSVSIRQRWQSWRARFARWRGSFRFWGALVLVVIVLLLGYYAAADRYTPFTSDAYAQAFVVQVAPQVGGQVQSVHVKEGDTVAKGALLFELDPRPFEHKVAMLKAQLVDAEHQVEQLAAQLAAAKAEVQEMSAEAEYALSVLGQEEVIYKKESTTERKYLDAVQKRKATEAVLERSKCTAEKRRLRFGSDWRRTCIGRQGQGPIGRSRTEPGVFEGLCPLRQHDYELATARSATLTWARPC